MTAKENALAAKIRKLNKENVTLKRRISKLLEKIERLEGRTPGP
jgi:cell division protein FtsB